MSHRSLEQLEAAEAALKERLGAVRAEIRNRKASAIGKLAKSYARAISAASAANGGKVPSPEELAAMLAPKPAAKRAPRRRKPKAEA